MPTKAKSTTAKESKKGTKSTTVKSANKTKKPSAKAIKQAERMKWFMALERKDFVKIIKEWNAENLHIEIPQNVEGYDGWLNYFKTLSPRIIERLAVTGLDILPTEAYAALSFWHDVIKNPSRIKNIHQSGLTGTGAADSKTIVQLAQANDRLGVLRAMRDKLAGKLDKGTGARDTAAMTREMTEIMQLIEEYEKRQGPKKGTVLAGLMADVDLRTKRPGRGGGGARNTSYKSKRVTIDDLEA